MSRGIHRPVKQYEIIEQTNTLISEVQFSNRVSFEVYLTGTPINANYMGNLIRNSK